MPRSSFLRTNSPRWAVAVVAAALALGLTPNATASASLPFAHEAAPGDPLSTGPLVACPASYDPGEIADYSGFFNGFSTAPAMGGYMATAISKQDCAWQNLLQFSPRRALRAYTAAFSPNEIPVSSAPQRMSLRVSGVTLSAITGFANWGCAPATSFTGCAATWRPDIVMRPADPSGAFTGKFLSAQNNPWFYLDYSACGGSSSSDSSLPCQVRVRFSTDVNGRPILQKSLQVAVAIEVRGTDPTFGKTFVDGVVSFVLRAGGSITPSASAAPSVVVYGGRATISGTIRPVTAPSSVALDRAAAGRGVPAWRQVATGQTTSAGRVSFRVAPTTSYRYRIRLVNAPLGAAVVSPAVVVSVRAAVTLATPPKARAGVVTLVAKVRPALGRATLQRLVRGVWKPWATGVVAPRTGRVSFAVRPPRGATTVRAVVPALAGRSPGVSVTRVVRG